MTTDERIAYEGTCTVARSALSAATFAFQSFRDHKNYDQLEAALAFLSDATECLTRLSAMRGPEVVEE